MIRGFEDETQELNEYEYNVLLPKLVKGLKQKIGRENAVTSRKVCDAFKQRGYEVSGARFRKMIRYIRDNWLIPELVASSKGYWISESEQELVDYIYSVRQRARSIDRLADELEEQRKQIYDRDV